jgi:hypothetical protein
LQDRPYLYRMRIVPIRMKLSFMSVDADQQHPFGALARRDGIELAKLLCLSL